MEKDLDQQILNMSNKIQWSLGETFFRVKKLKELMDNNPAITDQVKVSLLALLNSLEEISSLYRHDIAQKIRDQIKR